MSDNDMRYMLVEELERLRAGALDAAKGNHPPGLVAFCRGLSNKELHALSQHLPGDVLALPLEREASPVVLRLMDLLETFAEETGRDPQTGLVNRVGFEKRLAMEIERAVRAKHSLSLAVLRLAPVNSAQLSDAAHVRVEQRLCAALVGIVDGCIRRYDKVARFGEREFGMFFPGAGMHKARLLMERIVAEVRKLHEMEQAEGAGALRVFAGVSSIKGKVRISAQRMIELATEAVEGIATSAGPSIASAPIPDLAHTERKTLVRSSEKLFLFTGQWKEDT